jgi:hypothetical protein
MNELSVDVHPAADGSGTEMIELHAAADACPPFVQTGREGLDGHGFAPGEQPWRGEHRHQTASQGDRGVGIRDVEGGAGGEAGAQAHGRTLRA